MTDNTIPPVDEELFIQYGDHSIDASPEPTSVHYSNGHVACRTLSGHWVLKSPLKMGYYIDLTDSNHQWSPDDQFFKDCLGTLERIEQIIPYLNVLKDSRIVVKDTHPINKTI